LCKFFLALPGFEEKIMKSLDQLSYTLAGYPVSGLTGYKKNAGLSGRISGASLLLIYLSPGYERGMVEQPDQVLVDASHQRVAQRHHMLILH
jgi:hypothetical protein